MSGNVVRNFGTDSHSSEDEMWRKGKAMRLVLVPQDKALGWSFTSFLGTVTVSTENGERIQGTVVSVDDVRYAELISKFGKLTIGYNNRYGQWAFEENGGAVMVPYAINPNGELFVAGGFEMRLLINEGENMFTPPGGFSLSQETTENAAKRETLEETGVHINNLIKVGEGTPNRAFWIKQPDGNWPVTFYACRVDWSALVNRDGQWVMTQTEANLPELDKLGKLIFLRVVEAMAVTNDGIAVTAYAKTLVAWQAGLLF